MDDLSPCPLVTVPQSTKVGHYRTESSKSEKYRRIPFQNKKYIKMRQIAKLLERITFTSVLTNLGISCGHLHLHIGEQRNRAYVAEKKGKNSTTYLMIHSSAKRIFPINYDV